jgi:hypothetical protein
MAGAQVALPPARGFLCVITFSEAAAILISREQFIDKLGSGKDNEYEFHQHNVGQDHEERSQNHRLRSGAPHSFRFASCPHSLKASDKPDNQAIYSGLERWWKNALKVAP